MRSLWMLGASLCFALMAAFVKMGAAHFSFFELVGYRSLVGVLLIGSWILATHRSVKTTHLWGHFKRCFLGTFSMTIWFYTLGYLPLATGLTLNYTNPIFMALFVLLGAFVKKTSAPWGLIAATVAGFAGVVLMLNPTVDAGQTVPAMFGLFSGLLAAFVGIQIQELARMNEPTWRIVFYFTLFGTVWGFAGNLLACGSFSAFTSDSIPALLGIGVSATVAQLCMTQAYGVKNILLSAVLQYSAIIFAALFGFLFFGDTLNSESAAGIAVIILSSIAASLFVKKRKNAKAD